MPGTRGTNDALEILRDVRADLLRGYRGDHAAAAGASNNPRAFSNATWGTGRPPTA